MLGDWRSASPCFGQSRALKVFLFPTVLSLFCCTWTFSSCSKQELLSSCYVQSSHCCSYSCCRAQAQYLCCSGLVAPRHVVSSQARNRMGCYLIKMDYRVFLYFCSMLLKTNIQRDLRKHSIWKSYGFQMIISFNIKLDESHLAIS